MKRDSSWWWSADELERLKALYLDGSTDIEIGQALNRTAGAVSMRRMKLGLNREADKWEEHERQRRASSPDAGTKLLAAMDKALRRRHG